MGQVVVTGGTCMCSFGTAPGTIIATAQAGVKIEGKPVAILQDVGQTNITPFAMCTSLANPQVAAATAAALGVLTPQPCMLSAAGTWVSANPAKKFCGQPCVTTDCQLICANGMGTIKIVFPGQLKVSI